MKLPISKKFKLRNKTFVWIGRVRGRVYWYTRKFHKPFETDEKLKVAKQATSKTSFLPYQAQSSVLW